MASREEYDIEEQQHPPLGARGDVDTRGREMTAGMLSIQEADDLDGFVRDFGHPNFDNDFTDFDGKVEAVYLEHTGTKAKSEIARPKTATHRRPPPVADAKSKASGVRAEYKPRVSDSVLKEVRNTLTPSFDASGSAPTRVAMNRPATASSIGTDATKRKPKSTQQYLRDHKRKQESIKKERAETADKCLRELQYSYLYKMGEMNEWCTTLQVPTLYRAYKESDGSLSCHVYESGEFVKELSMNLLDKRYKALQGRHAEAVFRGQIECDENKPRSHMLSEEEQCRRQQEIREVLLQTMNLTNKLKEQLTTLLRRDMLLSPFVVE